MKYNILRNNSQETPKKHEKIPLMHTTAILIYKFGAVYIWTG